MAVLDDLVDSLFLLDGDRERLRRDRGFTDKMIDSYRLRSCTLNNLRVVNQMLATRDPKDMIAAQIVVPHPFIAAEWAPNFQLLAPNILIPYLDDSGKVTKVRPHKFGFRGEPPRVFKTRSASKKSLTCIITESEFKAIAAEQYGYAAIGIPGITTMSGKNWNYFLDVIKSIDTAKFVIMFDNEVKDDPALAPLGRYKERWQDRYETSIYAYAMCQKILNEGIPCAIATLPDDWRVDGKIDIDGALAQGRKLHEFKPVVDAALSPLMFKNQMPVPEKHQGFIERRLKSFSYKSQITVIGNCFFREGGVDKKGVPQPPVKLMNCHVRVENTYIETGTEVSGLRRDLVVVDEFNIRSQPTVIYASSMASRGAFMGWLMGLGNYLFHGHDKDVVDVWEYIFSHDESNIVHLLDRCGYVKEHNFWIFGNILLRDGVQYSPNEQGIFWVDDIGYKCNTIHADDPIASLVMNDTEFDVKLFLKYLGDVVGDANEAKLLLGWVIAVIASPSIIETFKFFPLLFLYGKRQGGKTTIMRWLSSFFGLADHSVNLSTSTVVGVQRGLSYYSSLPLVCDDWREPDVSRKFANAFLGVYNRQSGLKGVKSRFGLFTTAIRSCLVVMGEHMISDNGLQSRFVSFHIAEEKRLHDRLEELDALSIAASKFTVKLLTESHDLLKTDLPRRIKKRIADMKDRQDRMPSKRVLANLAILAESYTMLLGSDEAFEKYLDETVAQAQYEVDTNDIIHNFAAEFQFGLAESHIHAHHFKFDAEGNHVVLWLAGINRVLNNYYRRDTDNTLLLAKQLRNQPYYVRAVNTEYPGSPSKYPSIVLDVKKMPESLRIYFEGADANDA